jgi:HEAT repeat protein
MKLDSVVKLNDTTVRSYMNRRIFVLSSIFFFTGASLQAASSLSERLLSADDRSRQSALEEVSQLDGAGRQSEVQALNRALKGGDVDVRERALQALAKFGEDAKIAIPSLQKCLGDDYPVIRQRAVEALRSVGPAAIPALTSALQSENSEVRGNAALALSGMAEKNKEEIAPALVKALRNHDAGVRQKATDGLEVVGKSAIPSILPLLTSESSADRLAAVQALARIPTTDVSVSEQLTALWEKEDSPLRTAVSRALTKEGASAVSPLTHAMESSQPEVRRLAAETLGDIGRAASGAVSALITALKDSDSHVRLSAATALGKMGSEAASAVPALREATKDENATVAQRASEALTNVTATHVNAVAKKKNLLEGALVIPMTGDAPVPKTAKKNIPKAGKTVRRSVEPSGPAPEEKPRILSATPARIATWIQQLTSSTTPEAQTAQTNLVGAGKRAVPDLVKTLRNSDKVDRAMVLTTLGDIGMDAKPAWLAVLEFVSDFSEDLRRASAQALVKIDPPQAIDTFTTLLQGADPTPKPAVVEALGLMPNAATNTPLIVEQLKSKDPALREAAAAALTSIGTPEALKTVTEFREKEKSTLSSGLVRDLGKDLSHVNFTAVDALVKVGKPAVPALQAALSDHNPITRQGATLALKKLGPAAAPATDALISALGDSEMEVRHGAADALEAIGTPASTSPLAFFRLKSKVTDPWDSLMRKFGFK